ncbi:MAG: LA2681 family HEPN domain-containing protein [Candidatus Nanoarchaeia archaeon]|nr:LA2681 family HEPN domain-containing protein [Candidatus Nanoarchaeia archaeon]
MSKDTIVRNTKASILIEVWNYEKDKLSHIQEAISHLKIALKQNTDYEESTILMNLGNAYHKLANYEIQNNSRNLNPIAIGYLQNTIYYFRESLKQDYRADTLINLGNALDYLGRHIEAIEYYDKAINLNNRHYNAWVNRGISCWNLSKKADNQEDSKKLLSEAMMYIAIELELYPDCPIDDETKTIVRNFLNNNKITIDIDKTIKKHLPKKKGLLYESFNLYKNIEENFDEFYNTFCEKYALFLNLHFDCEKCDLKFNDLIQFGIITDINDFKKPYEVITKWHELIDNYKTARLLLVLSQYRHQDFLFLNKQRYDPDYSLNYIVNVELLKNCFTFTMNIFDKIAFFLNDYEELGLPDNQVTFYGSKSIFYRTEILKRNNWQKDLVAIDSIRYDLEKSEYKKLVDIRNYIVHRYFMLHDIIKVKNLTYPYDSKGTPIEKKEYHMDIQEFFKMTILLLQYARNTIFSLGFFVSQKENEKARIVKGIIPTIKLY